MTTAVAAVAHDVDVVGDVDFDVGVGVGAHVDDVGAHVGAFSCSTGNEISEKFSLFSTSCSLLFLSSFFDSGVVNTSSFFLPVSCVVCMLIIVDAVHWMFD